MTLPLDALGAALTAFGVGLVLVPAVRRLARRTGMVCAPRQDRWHAAPTALLGGVAIAAACGAGLVVAGGNAVAPAWPVLVAGALMFVTGLVDDVVPLRPAGKLALQAAAATVVVASGHVLPWTGSASANAAVTLLWMVGITNAINLLDNMDGLAAGVAAIAAIVLGVTFVLNGQDGLTVLPAALAGACVAFLVFNVGPASIFMGDCGSLFLGAMLGGLALLSSYGRSRSVASVLLTPVLIMAIPILDTALVTVTRKLRGQRVSQGGRDHSSHRLVALGISERRAVLILWGLAGVSGGLALGVRWLGTEALLAIVPGFALAMLVFALFLDSRPAPAAATARGRAGAVALDVVLAAFAYVSSYGIRWDWAIPEPQWSILGATAPWVVAIEVAALGLGGVYRPVWRRARVEDLWVVVRSTMGGALAAGVGVLLAYQLEGPSRGVLALNALALLVAVTAARVSLRLLEERLPVRAVAGGSGAPVLIYGLGEGAGWLAREMLADPSLARRPVGFLGGHRRAGYRQMHGLPVFCRGDVAAVVAREGVREVIVAEREADDAVLEALAGLGVRVAVLRPALEGGG